MPGQKQTKLDLDELESAFGALLRIVGTERAALHQRLLTAKQNLVVAREHSFTALQRMLVKQEEAKDLIHATYENMCTGDKAHRQKFHSDLSRLISKIDQIINLIQAMIQIYQSVVDEMTNTNASLALEIKQNNSKEIRGAVAAGGTTVAGTGLAAAGAGSYDRRIDLYIYPIKNYINLVQCSILFTV